MILNANHVKLIAKAVEEMGSQKRLADRIGVYPQSVGRWISGESKEIKEKHIPKLATALGMDVQTLREWGQTTTVNEPQSPYGKTPPTQKEMVFIREFLDQPAYRKEWFYTMMDGIRQKEADGNPAQQEHTG